jgi:Fic family protein
MSVRSSVSDKQHMLNRVRGEFLEMPGLRLRLDQAQRLWGLDRSTCEELLKSLVDSKFLSRRSGGVYCRF